MLRLSSDASDLCPDFGSLCPKGVYARKIHACDFASSATEVATESDYQDALNEVSIWMEDRYIIINCAEPEGKASAVSCL